jgi:hypothetical protein
MRERRDEHPSQQSEPLIERSEKGKHRGVAIRGVVADKRHGWM